MKHRTKNTLRAMAEHIGLKVVFVSHFGDDVHGRLLVREKRILINAHMPRNEHVFTMLHEIGHFIQHVLNPHRKHHPRVLDIRWNIELLEKLSSKIRRHFRFIFNKKSGKEWEADLWAMCAFVYLAKRIGCHDELTSFLNRHPEKRRMYWLVKTAIIYCDCKRCISTAYKILSDARRTAAEQLS
jgi:hypothetical protein